MGVATATGLGRGDWGGGVIDRSGEIRPSSWGIGEGGGNLLRWPTV